MFFEGAKKALWQVDFNNATSIAEQVELPSDTIVSLTETKSNMRGTGYRNEYYHVLGTSDAVVIERNCIDENGQFRDMAYMAINFYSYKRDYGRRCKEVSKAIGCPMELALAIGPDEVADFVSLLQERIASGVRLTPEDIHELDRCGIDRRISAIERVCGENVACGMGQINSGRVASYIRAQVPEAPKERKRRTNLHKWEGDSESASTSLAELLMDISL